MGPSFAERLAVRAVGSHRFEGICHEASPGRGFGGQVMALALRAAHETVEPPRLVHSFHARFLRPVDPAFPVVYAVGRASDTRSFSRREVVAEQGGKIMLEATVAFVTPAPAPDFQVVMPEIGGPDGLIPERTDPVDVRHVEGDALYEGRLADPHRQRVWLRASETLPADAALHATALAYMSDLTILWLSLSVNRLPFAKRHEIISSLEHSIWFHRPARADQWLLYDQSCPSTSNGLGMVQGNLFTKSGSLVASTVQVGTLRPTAGVWG